MMRWLVISAFLACSVGHSYGQTYLLNTVRMVDRTTRQSLALSQPSGLPSSVRLVFPPNPGALNQTLFAKSISRNDVTLDWATTSGTSATDTAGSVRIVTNQDAATPAGMSANVSANKAYRYLSNILIRRSATGTGTNDQYRIQVSGPSNTSFLSMAIRPLTQNATATTGNVPSYTSTTSSTSVTSGDINPQGATDNVTNAYWYQIEGVVVTGSSSGTLTLTALRDAAAAANDRNVILFALSNLFVSEIQ